MFKKKNLLNSTQLSETLEALSTKPKNGKTRVSELLEDFHENGILLAMILISLPVAIPLPYPPGFTTIVAVPLFILSVQMLFGYRKVWLPRSLTSYNINNSNLISISNKVLPKLKTLEKYIKPRLNFAQSTYCEQLVGLISFICSLSIAIPWPLTNAIPALGIAIMAIGLLNRDGITIIAGIFVSIVGLIVALFMIIASWKAIAYILTLFF